MKGELYRKSLKHPDNPNYYIILEAIHEEKRIDKSSRKSFSERYQIEELVFKGKMSYWFRARISVTNILNGISTSLEIKECSYSSFENYFENRYVISKLIKKCTHDLDEKIENKFPNKIDSEIIYKTAA